MQQLAHKIRIYPNEHQAHQLICACGVARFAYNWGLNRWNELYLRGNKPSWELIRAEFNQIKEEQFPWVYSSPKDANQYAFKHLGAAFKNFFKGLAKHPTFKKKNAHDSFTLSNDQIKLDNNSIRLPLISEVKLAEVPRFSSKVMSVTVSREVDRWFVSINYQGEFRCPNTPKNDVIALDRGVKTFCTLSDGTKIDVQDENHKKLRKLNKSFSRKLKGSRNRKKAQVRLSRHHAKCRNTRQDRLHKLSTKLCRENQSITIQDDFVKGWQQNKSFSRRVQTYGLGEFLRQITYKSEIFGTDLRIVNRFAPTSKTCHACGNVNSDLKLSDRIFRCDCCGIVEDRDVNAALSIAGYAGFQACGQTDLWTQITDPSRIWLKQEPSSEIHLNSLTG
jgi:putative transposase